MKSSLRDSDVFARLGGDEFVVLLANTSKQHAEEIMAKFNRTLMKSNQEAHRGYDVTFSHGIVEINPDKRTPIDELLRKGDKLMFEVKKAKKLTSPVSGHRSLLSIPPNPVLQPVVCANRKH